MTFSAIYRNRRNIVLFALVSISSTSTPWLAEGLDLKKESAISVESCISALKGRNKDLSKLAQYGYKQKRKARFHKAIDGNFCKQTFTMQEGRRYHRRLTHQIQDDPNSPIWTKSEMKLRCFHEA